jgi:hypothetical protein
MSSRGPSGLRGAASTIVVAALLGGSPPPASSEGPGGTPRSVSYDLYASYPNLPRTRDYFLRGVNAYGSATSTTGPERTSLWFEPLTGGAFKQFNTTPYRVCHWDLLRWDRGERGPLVYLATHADCYSDHTAIEFSPGIAYMPKSWAPGEHWTERGVSGTVFSENGIAVCAGTNTWRSRVLGLATAPNGEPAVHTQTNEVQALSPIAGAPNSASCPAGRVTRFGWQENFYVGAGLSIRRLDGSAAGSDLGLMRSTGGNPAATRAAGHPQWDSVFDHWEPRPPADAGTVATTTTNVAIGSGGNTITFVYTAPARGVEDASLTIVVPTGWAPPVTADAVGCTTATIGAVTTSGAAITVSALTLPPGGQTVIDYGARSGDACTASDGATAPSTAGAPVWQARVTLTPGGPFTNLSTSPSIPVA